MPRLGAWILLGSISVPALLLNAASAEPAAPAPNLRQEGTYTADASITQLLGGDVHATVDAGTKFRVLPTTYIKLHASKPSTRCATIELLSGRMGVTVPPGEPPEHSVQIKLPGGLSAVPLGGRIIAAAVEKGSTVANIDGRVLVGKGTTWGEVKRGMAESYSNGAQVNVRPLPGVPTVHVRDQFVLAPAGGSTSTEVQLSGETLKRFEVTLSKVDGNSQTPVGTYTTTTGPLELPGFSAGRYQVVARGFDEWGLSYRQSQPVSIHVMNYELPKDAHVVDGKIHLLPGQRLKIRGSHELEMTYGDQSDYFVPLSTDVGLGARTHEVARFRVKGSSIEARLEMVSRPFTAHIELHPAAARWPEDLVQVSIRLTNQAGRLAPDASDVSKLVTINSRKVALSWRNQHGVLVANLPPQSGSGPWRVQVELKDKLGTFATHSSELRARRGSTGT
ncbi:MAG TPA: hypothetical protein VI197_26370 [Polyangiaceae bacterium]